MNQKLHAVVRNSMNLTNLKTQHTWRLVLIINLYDFMFYIFNIV